MSRRLANYVVDWSTADLPPAGVSNVKLLITHVVGAGLAAHHYEPAIAGVALGLARRTGTSEESSIIGSAMKASPAYAAFANGALMHALDFDDWAATGHPTCMVLAAALAAAGSVGASGSDVIGAVALGIELFERLASSCPDVRARGWHGTSIFGAIGAATSTARLLGLTAPDVERVFAAVASSATGLVRQRGTMMKALQVGFAARNGVEAGLLGQAGASGMSDPLTGPLGLLDAITGISNCNVDDIESALGTRPMHVVVPGVGLKAFPCCAIFFSAIAGITQACRTHGVTADDVERVDVGCSDWQLSQFGNLRPMTALEAKFSFAYCCAAALIDGDVTLSTFEANHMPTVLEAMRKVRLTEDSRVPLGLAFLERGWTPVTIHTKRGSAIKTSPAPPLGDPRNPLGRELVRSRFVLSSRDVLGLPRAERAADLLLALDACTDIRTVLDALCPPRVTA